MKKGVVDILRIAFLHFLPGFSKLKSMSMCPIYVIVWGEFFVSSLHEVIRASCASFCLFFVFGK